MVLGRGSEPHVMLRQRRPVSTLALLLGMLVAPSSPAFDLEGHRGARGLAPENTLAAFRRALEIGVTTIETDLAVTRDDVVVISHNPFSVPTWSVVPMVIGLHQRRDRFAR